MPIWLQHSIDLGDGSEQRLAIDPVKYRVCNDAIVSFFRQRKGFCCADKELDFREFFSTFGNRGLGRLDGDGLGLVSLPDFRKTFSTACPNFQNIPWVNVQEFQGPKKWI